MEYPRNKSDYQIPSKLMKSGGEGETCILKTDSINSRYAGTGVAIHLKTRFKKGGFTNKLSITCVGLLLMLVVFVATSCDSTIMPKLKAFIPTFDYETPELVANYYGSYSDDIGTTKLELEIISCSKD